jgi:hypothetical protein
LPRHHTTNVVVVTTHQETSKKPKGVVKLQGRNVRRATGKVGEKKGDTAVFEVTAVGHNLMHPSSHNKRLRYSPTD